jgi:hypothetical protein
MLKNVEVKAMDKDLVKRANVEASQDLAALSAEQLLAVVGGQISLIIAK